MSIKMESSQTYLASKQESNSCWSNRSRTEKRLLLWILLLVPLVVGLVITVAVIANNYQRLSSQQSEEGKENNGSGLCLTADCIKAAADLLNAVDLSVDPCDDFYTFACGQWEQNHALPDEKSRLGTFDILNDENLEKYKESLSAPVDSTDSNATSNAKKMFQSCINEEIVWNITMPSVLKMLKSFGGWPIITSNWSESGFDWIKVQAAFFRTPPSPLDSPSPLVSVDVALDGKNTTQNIIYFDQPSLDLNRDYLLNPNNYSGVIKAYKTFVQQVAAAMAKSEGFSPPMKDNMLLDIEEIVALQTRIAEISLPPAARRKKDLIYHKLTIEDLTNLTKNEIDWLRFTQLVFDDVMEITKTESVVVNDKEYFIQLVGLLNSTSPRAVANYMLWKYIRSFLKHMSREIQLYYFTYSKVLTGVKSEKPRWKSCAEDIDEGLGMALGSMFVKKYFPQKSKEMAKEMIGYIRSSFLSMVESVDWMDEPTRKAALEKGKNIAEQIGYPDWILNPEELDKYYDDVIVTEDNYFATLKSTGEAKSLRSLKTLRDHPADKTKWEMTPGTVNAYYSSEKNSINFPAGILQSPFYSENRPMALNFGAIGSVIGHEITHGFDDEGRLYDKDGNLKKWWSDDVVQRFQEKAQCYVDQYGRFCPPEVNGVCVNGNLTLGENIADNGGIKASIRAYKQWVKSNGEEPRLPGLEELSMEKIFFIGFSQVWCSKIRNEYLLNLLFKDPHSPTKYRVLGTISNSEEFASAYECSPKSQMNRGNERCTLW